MNIFVLEHAVNGFYSAVAYFENESAALGVLTYLRQHVPGAHQYFRINARPVWETADSFIKEGDTHEAKTLRREMDPEWAEYKRLREKFNQ